MNKPEWMQVIHRHSPNPDMRWAVNQGVAEGWHDGQKKLLEYLIENSYLVQPAEGKAYRVTNHYTLKQMLKQLEVN